MTKTDYRTSHLDRNKAQAYDRKFTTNPFRSMMWDFERDILDQIIARHLPSAFTHLDFACGTARILAYLADRASMSVGLDVSAAMLEVARGRVSRGELMQADITAQDPLQDRTFDLITAFRFFPNAQPELREAVMARLVYHLKPGGVIVFNNHLNSSSVLIRLAHIVGAARTLGASEQEMIGLVQAHGGRIVDAFHVGVLPGNERYRILPSAMLRSIEAGLRTKPRLRSLAQNIVYVCAFDRGNS